MPHTHESIQAIFLPIYHDLLWRWKKKDQHIGITLLTINGFVVEM